MLRARLTAPAVVLLAAFAFAPARAATTPPIAEGVSPDGERYRLMPGKVTRRGEVRGSWCLRLERTGQVQVIDGETDGPFSLALGVCGPRPAPAVSGELLLDCEQRLVFVFGAARDGIGTIRVVRHRRPPVAATRHRLPPRSGFRGSTFLAIVPLDTHAVRIRVTGVPRERHPRIAGLRKVCAPLPGGQLPSGPFASFDTRKRPR